MNIERTFGQVMLHPVYTHDVKTCLEVVLMGLMLGALYQHVFNVSFHGTAEQPFKKHVHHFLVSHASVADTERHNSVTKQTIGSYKRTLAFVLLSHHNLVIALKGVHKAHERIPDRFIYHLMGTRQWVWAQWADLVQVGVIHTHSPGWRLRDQDYISYPFGVCYLSNMGDLDEGSHFSSHELPTI